MIGQDQVQIVNHQQDQAIALGLNFGSKFVLRTQNPGFRDEPSAPFKEARLDTYLLDLGRQEIHLATVQLGHPRYQVDIHLS